MRTLLQILRSLFMLPLLAVYVFGSFLMAAFLIAASCEQTYEISPDVYRADTDSCLVELEVSELRAEGKVMLPGTGAFPESATIVKCNGQYHMAPHVFCGCWELKCHPGIAGQLAGILGMHGGGDACMYSTSPARPYEGVPIVLQGRQHGRSIEVLEIADSYGCYEQQMVSSPWKNFLRGIFCLVAAVGMSGIWWLVRSYPLRCFVFVVGCCLSLLGLAAGVLVWTQVTVHAEQASGWVAPLAVAVSLLGLVASLSGCSYFRK